MDPIANVKEQRELAERLLDWVDAEPGEGVSTDKLIIDAARLAELVQALDEWRTRGGFDPYLDGRQVPYSREELFGVARSSERELLGSLLRRARAVREATVLPTAAVPPDGSAPPSHAPVVADTSP